ncbi:serine/threonine-protein kinase pim-2-like [Anguilla anguilla]|uniref:serine/threonine-protein kinase pim-2-like n=1 Tax=Anguilla anguilla TaxID=7936 RepID=UPI0015AF8370|nr:serine/threonine-protein kinase pim-2-like [Anguilla anguilla]
MQEIPLEVFLLLIMSTGSPSPKGVIRLLDWYKLQEEVLLVLERPLPSLDLFDFVLQRGGFLQEGEAKVILRQLVEAVLEIHGRGVVHRDIKLDNVLVQTDASGPLVHVLDFGCGAMLNESPHKFHGRGSADSVRASLKILDEIIQHKDGKKIKLGEWAPAEIESIETLQ